MMGYTRHLFLYLLVQFFVTVWLIRFTFKLGIMAKFMNIVRCKVKSSSREEYLKIINEMPKFDGQISAKFVETKPNEFFMIGEWNSEDDIAKARPKMIEFLDKARHTLEELSPELGVTDPHSGTIIVEK